MHEDDLQEILNRWRQVKTDCDAWHKKIEHFERLYSLEHYYGERGAGLLPQMERITLSTPKNVVDLAVGILTSNELVWTVQATDESPTATERASRQELFLDGVLYVNSERQETHLRTDWTLKQLRDGCVVLRTYWDPGWHRTLTRETRPPEGPAQPPPEVWRFKRLPLVVQVISAKNIFPKAGGRLGRWQYIFYSQERTVYDVEAEYGIVPEQYQNFPESQKRLIKGIFLDYWAEKPLSKLVTVCPECRGKNPAKPSPLNVTSIFGNMLGGAPMFVPPMQPCEDCGSMQPGVEDVEVEWGIENAVLFQERFLIPPRVMEDYEELPYTLMFCTPVNGEKPHEWTDSLLTAIDEPVYEKEKLLNRQRRQLNLDSARSLVSKTRDGRQVKVDTVFGDVVSLAPDEDIGYYPAMGTPEDMKFQFAVMDQQVQEGSFPSATYGEGLGQSSGYAVSLMSDAGKIRLTQPIQQQQQALAIIARKCQALISRFAPDATVEVYGRRGGQPYTARLTGEDMAGCRIDAALVPNFPNDRVRNVAMANQLRTIVSEDTLMEDYLGIHQPDIEAKKKLAEVAAKHPLMVEFQLRKMLTEWARRGDASAQAMLARLQQGGMPQPPGPPPQPVGTEQIPGQPSATLGAFPPQALGGAPPGQGMPGPGEIVPPVTLPPMGMGG